MEKFTVKLNIQLKRNADFLLYRPKDKFFNKVPLFQGK